MRYFLTDKKQDPGLYCWLSFIRGLAVAFERPIKSCEVSFCYCWLFYFPVALFYYCSVYLDPEAPPAFLKCGEWIYPLHPGRSPALKTFYKTYMFPDISLQPQVNYSKEKTFAERNFRNFAFWLKFAKLHCAKFLRMGNLWKFIPAKFRKI